MKAKVSHEVKVVCTRTENARPTHGQVTIAVLDFYPLENGSWVVNERDTRERPFPAGGPQVVTWVDEEGVEHEGTATIGDRAIDSAPSTRKVTGGWLWRCPKCRMNRPLSEANLLRWREALPDRRVLDISLLPRNFSDTPRGPSN